MIDREFNDAPAKCDACGHTGISISGTAGKGLGHVYACTYCHHRMMGTGYPERHAQWSAELRRNWKTE